MTNPLRLLIHVPVPWVIVLTFLVGVGLEHLAPIRMSIVSMRVTDFAGAMLLITGAIVAATGWLIFRRVRTTTVPGRASSRLVTWGPYRFSRNPMYVGLFIAYLGEAGLLRQVWPMLLLPFTVAYINWIVVPVEEVRLREVFGEEYDKYRARVRRWI